MQKKDTQRGKAVVEVMQSESVVSIAKEYLEVGIDNLLESGALKDIPLVNTVAAIFSTAGSIRDQLLATKLLRFLSQLSKISKANRIAMVRRLNEDNKFSGKAGAAVIEILDRMESDKKPELAAKVFAAYAREEISFEELRRLLLALERVPSFDIDKLEQFSNTEIEDSMKMDESLLLAFVLAGLAQNNGGFGGGAIRPSNLCKLFVRVVLSS